MVGGWYKKCSFNFSIPEIFKGILKTYWSYRLRRSPGMPFHHRKR